VVDHLLIPNLSFRSGFYKKSVTTASVSVGVSKKILAALACHSVVSQNSATVSMLSKTRKNI